MAEKKATEVALEAHSRIVSRASGGMAERTERIEEEVEELEVEVRQTVVTLAGRRRHSIRRKRVIGICSGWVGWKRWSSVGESRAARMAAGTSDSESQTEFA
jgi:hypothetical protein